MSKDPSSHEHDPQPEAQESTAELPAASTEEPPALVPAVTARAPSAPRKRARGMELGLLAGGLAAVGVVVFLGAGKAEQTGRESAAEIARSGASQRAVKAIEAVDMPACSGAEDPGAGQSAATGDPRARQSAQRGLDYLAKVAAAWQDQHNCYGCHVQAVTVEALAVGVHNQYDVRREDLGAVLRGMLDLPGGARVSGAAGLSHPSPSIASTGKLLGGAAFARYDQWVDDSISDFMLAEARALRDLQGTDGQVSMPWTSAPVATGNIQAMAHAVVAWKQAYERTADDQWLTAVSRAEDWLHGVIATWKDQPPSSSQDINYAIIGMLAAGVSSSEAVMSRLADEMVSRQNPDGGFPLAAGGASSPFATGQTLYALRLMGRSDSDAAIARGTAWLIEHQQSDGSWSSAGFGKAEAMWAVLGLVSVDVLSVSVDGLESGQHVDGVHRLAIHAKDNKGGGVAQIEVYVDDIRVAGACGASLTSALDASGWEDGKHVVEVRATNARGQVSRRFLEVYAGDVYLTQIGTRYSAGTTEIALRNIMAADRENQVEIEILEAEDKDGALVAGKSVHRMSQNGRQGSMSFQWSGEGAGQGGQGQKYLARVRLLDQTGKPVQSEEIEFVHDTLEAQRDNWAQLEGSLALPGGDVAQNAEVELLDDKGRVVGRTTSTKQGKYRFRNIEAKQGYQVRVKKQGFSAVAPAAAAKGEDNKADLQLQAE